jgi:xylulokinase
MNRGPGNALRDRPCRRGNSRRPKALWLRRHEPSIFARTRLILQPRDVVLHRLTGLARTDETHANATLFFNLRERAWDASLLAAFDVDPAMFPPALPPWEIAAELPRCHRLGPRQR